MNDYRYLFGPVPSRRLGRSLGVDLTPLKTCSFDCIFCQLGRTTRKTMARTEYVPLADVIKELEDWLARTGDDFAPREVYWERFGYAVDPRHGHVPYTDDVD